MIWLNCSETMNSLWKHIRHHFGIADNASVFVNTIVTNKFWLFFMLSHFEIVCFVFPDDRSDFRFTDSQCVELCVRMHSIRWIDKSLNRYRIAVDQCVGWLASSHRLSRRKQIFNFHLTAHSEFVDHCEKISFYVWRKLLLKNGFIGRWSFASAENQVECNERQWSGYRESKMNSFRTK